MPLKSDENSQDEDSKLLECVDSLRDTVHSLYTSVLSSFATCSTPIKSLVAIAIRYLISHEEQVQGYVTFHSTYMGRIPRPR